MISFVLRLFADALARLCGVALLRVAADDVARGIGAHCWKREQALQLLAAARGAGRRRGAAHEQLGVDAAALTVEVVEGHGQQETQRFWFFAPSFSSSSIVSGNGRRRCTGPFAMSTTVRPVRDTAFTSAPFETR